MKGAERVERSALEELERLRRMTWAQLSNYALRNEFASIAECRRARTRDELRLTILKAQFPAAEVTHA